MQDEKFWDTKEGGYFSSELEKNLVLRKKEYEDHAKPNGNALTCLNLLKLTALTGDQKYYSNASQILSGSEHWMKRYPMSFSHLLIACDYYLGSAKEVAIIGNDQEPFIQDVIHHLHFNYYPNKILAFSEEKNVNQLQMTSKKEKIQDKATVTICERGTCGLPIQTLEEVTAQMKLVNRYTLD